MLNLHPTFLDLIRPLVLFECSVSPPAWNYAPSNPITPVQPKSTTVGRGLIHAPPPPLRNALDSIPSLHPHRLSTRSPPTTVHTKTLPHMLSTALLTCDMNLTGPQTKKASHSSTSSPSPLHLSSWQFQKVSSQPFPLIYAICVPVSSLNCDCNYHAQVFPWLSH